MRTFITAALLGFATASSVQAEQDGTGADSTISTVNTSPDLWPELTDDQIYEGTDPWLRSWILRWDTNGDGRVPLAEMLDVVEIPFVTKEEIVTTHEPDYMWWRDEALVTKMILSTVHFNDDGRVTWGAELDKLAELTNQDSDYVMNHYAAYPSAGLTQAEVETFVADVLYDTRRDDTGKDHAETIVTRLIQECDDTKAKIDTARQIIIATLAKIQGIEIEYVDLFNPVQSGGLTSTNVAAAAAPVFDLQSMVKTAQVGGAHCLDFDNDSLDRLMANTDSSVVPHIDRLELMWDTNYQYVLGFDVQYSGGYSQTVLHHNAATEFTVVSAAIDIAEDDYINNVYGRAGDVWDKLEATTNAGQHVSTGGSGGGYNKTFNFDAEDPQIIGIGANFPTAYDGKHLACVLVHYIDRADLQ